MSLTMAEYLRIPAVSQGVLEILLTECPRAAWYASYLNPEREIEDGTAEQNIGSVAHAIFLEGSEACCAVINPEDYRGKMGGVPDGWKNDAIKAARDAAIEAGLIPILAPKMPAIRAMAGAAREYVESLRRTEPRVWNAFQNGISEHTIEWDDGGVPCKIRVDRLSDDGEIAINYKTTKTNVAPAEFARQMLRMGFDVGDAFYRRGIERVLGVKPLHLFLVQSTQAPYLCSLIALDPSGIALADAKVEAALATWRQCAATGVFPGHPARICFVEAPAWELAEAEARDIEAIGSDS